MPDALVWKVFWVAVATDLATGLGVLPFAVFRRMSESWQGMMTAAAAGMMLSASVFTLTGEALQAGSLWQVLLGLLAGAAFFAWTARLVAGNTWRLGTLSAAESRQGILLLIAMFIHSIPEGIAIGVGYATGELQFGLLLATAIAVHNIPEGTAVAVPLRARGVSLLACAGYAILTSVPQPIAAVPAFLLVSVFKPLLPLGLGFAGGAMIFLVAFELLPESLEQCTRSQAAWSLMIGLTAMLWLTGTLAI
jgi:ZIP family zinc transporter